MTQNDSPEAQSVRERYARRPVSDPRYSLLNPAALYALQERQRAMLQLFAALGFDDLETLRLLEIGSGDGGNLLDFLRMGFAPEHLSGIELLQERHDAARNRLPAGVALTCADATALALPAAAYDIVFQSTVFSSLLDDSFQQQLANVMWSTVKPGGGVLWYDFTVDNPRNPDVRGVPLARVRQLFPSPRMRVRRVTLAPPLSRTLAKVHPVLCGIANTLPLLRTHVLAWIEKPATG